MFISKRLPRASSSTPLLGRAGQRFNRVKVKDAEVIRKGFFYYRNFLSSKSSIVTDSQATKNILGPLNILGYSSFCQKFWVSYSSVGSLITLSGPLFPFFQTESGRGITLQEEIFMWGWRGNLCKVCHPAGSLTQQKVLQIDQKGLNMY